MFRKQLTRLFLVLALLPSAGAMAQGADQSADQRAALQDLDGQITQMMADWDVPGMALAIVKDDKILHSAGYGLLELGERRQVDDETRFAIGSSSKAFTAAALAILVDEGKLSWDDPVTDHLPWFQLYDPYATREMRVRDLLAHNSGLVRGDRVWYGTGLSPEEIVRRARFLPPNESLRSTFQYNNTMFIAAGLVIEAVSGKTWDAFVAERIFKPLGMVDSNTSIRDLEGLRNVATPHAKLEDEVQAIDWRNIDNAGPAGSINSNVQDMAQWLRLNLGGGKFEGEQIISEQAIQEMQSSQMIMRKTGLWGLLFEDSAIIAYGLGWFLAEYQGRLMVNHGGNIDGNTAYVSFMPAENTGLVILTNLNAANGFIGALNYEIYDRLLGIDGGDHNAKFLETIEGMTAQGKEAVQKLRDARIEGTSTTLPLESYAGSYDHAMYPGIVIDYRDGDLHARYADAFEAQLTHWHYDTFEADWKLAILAGGPPSLLRFVIGSDGQVEILHADIEGPVTFTRRPADAAAE